MRRLYCPEYFGDALVKCGEIDPPDDHDEIILPVHVDGVGTTSTKDDRRFRCSGQHSRAVFRNQLA